MKLCCKWLPLGTLIFSLLQACSSQKEVSSFTYQGEIPNENPFLESPDEKDSKSNEVNLFLTGNLNGEIQVCGCAVNPKGGLDRRWNYLEKNSKLLGISMDAGNALFANTMLDPSKEAEMKAKARFIAEMQKQLGVEAHNVGRLDMSAGLDFVKDIHKTSGLNWISSNLQDMNANFPFPRFFEKTLATGQKIKVVGLTDSESPGEWQVIDPARALKELLENTPTNTLIVVLSDLGEGKDRALMKQFSNLSMVFVGSRELGFVETPIQEAKSVLVRPGFQGQTIGHLKLKIWESREAWFAPEISMRLNKAYVGMRVELDNVRERGSIEERMRIESQWRENLYWYGKNMGGQRNHIEFTITGLSDAYAKPNAISKKMKAFQ